MAENGFAEEWRDARRVLAVRLDNVGDILMTTPALAAIRSAAPDMRVTLLASPVDAAIARFIPDVDDVIVFKAPWVKHPTNANESVGDAELRMVERLALRRFDAAIIFTVCTQSALPSALLCRMAGIPLRVAHSRENPYQLLSHWVPETDTLKDGMRHEVARQIALAASVGWSIADEQLRMRVDDSDRARVYSRLAQMGLARGEAYFVVHPGASAPSRRYPAQRFGIAADGIASATGAKAIFTGDRSEFELIDAARATMATPSISLAGELGLGELAALISESELLLSNNTGPAHIAAAVRTPAVVLYAMTNPQHTPWKSPARVVNHPVPCRNCLKSVCPQGHHDCLRKVEPGQVVAAGLQLLSERARAA